MSYRTANAIGLDYSLYRVGQGSRRKLDGSRLGFPATPGSNSREQVLSPAGAGNNPPATLISVTVKSFFFIRTSAKVSIKVTKADTTSYTQIVEAVFMMNPAEEVTIEIETAETYNVNAIVVWS